MMNTRQLFDPATSTYTYLLWDNTSRQAAIIDPVIELWKRDKNLIEELGLNLQYSLETHIHADHVTGGGLLRKAFDCKVGVHTNSHANCADILLQEGDQLSLGSQTLRVIHTPGHTDTDVCFLTDGVIFTGDTLLVHGSGRTDFQSGNAGQAYDSIVQKIFTLPQDTVIFPGHDYAGFTRSTVGEEQRFNPRLGNNRSREEYIRIMTEMRLPKPEKIDTAVPGNQGCGL